MHVWFNIDPSLDSAVSVPTANEISLTPLFLPNNINLKAVYCSVSNVISSTWASIALYKALFEYQHQPDPSEASSNYFNNNMQFKRVRSAEGQISGIGGTPTRVAMFLDRDYQMYHNDLYAIAWASGHVSTNFYGLQNSNTNIYYSFGTGYTMSGSSDWPEYLTGDGVREGGLTFGTPAFALLSRPGLRWLGR